MRSNYCQESDDSGEHSRGRLWHATTATEIKRFIAVLFAMGLVNKPSYRDYWSPDPVLCSLFHEPEEYEVVEETSVLFSEFSTGPKLYFVCKEFSIPIKPASIHFNPHKTDDSDHCDCAHSQRQAKPWCTTGTLNGEAFPFVLAPN